MSAVPQRRHTKLGRRNALRSVGAIQTPCRQIQPDPNCDCTACERYFDRLARRSEADPLSERICGGAS